MPTIVVGAGQAGLAVSRELTSLGVDHVVLERDRIGATWRRRWDTFCLVTPNWTVKLPGGAYDGDDPDGFMPRDEVVRHLERYAASFAAPLREGVAVRALMPTAAGLRLETSDGAMEARSVVLATGAYQRPHRPAGLEALPRGLPVIDAEEYSGPSAVAPGRVLVVGSGQTGAQLAEELHEAGRDVVLACGRAPWMPRRLDGVDFVRWIWDIGFMAQPRSQLPAPGARLGANPQASGHGGGHDLTYRTLRAMGVTLTGRFLGVADGQVRFADDLSASVAFGDARYDDLRRLIRAHCASHGLTPPEMPDPEPFAAEVPASIPLDALSTVIVTSGFRPDYTSWVRVPEAFDPLGFPLERDGTSVVVPGLFFCGVHFMRTRKSSLLMGVGEDAAIVARSVAGREALAS